MATTREHLLPQDVITEILLRLPVKSLLSFRIMLFDSYPPNILSIDIHSSLNDHDHSADDASLNLDDFLSYPADDASLRFSPLCFTNCGDIVGIFAHGGLVKFDDKGEQLEYRSFPDRHIGRYEMVVYTESLLSLPGGTEEA
ncbi:F-box-like protein [Trifolium pratense]|uniref:F-box-like protein n=1 Tax=Trifolium pratense TaxID=57577 RepID=A0A2K3LLX4_TRIPR|nr:F-box-like protein [Trifolium pratense]